MNHNLKRLIAIGTMHGITDIFMNTFLIARIYELANDSVQIIATYYIVQYIAIIATFIIFGNKIKSVPLKALQFGIIINFILLVFLTKADDNVMKYYITFAIVFGISQGAYYSPYAVLIGNYNDNAVRYCTVSNMLSNIIGIVFPITIGMYISTSSFAQVTITMLVVTTIQIIISLKIENIVMKKAKCNILLFVKKLKESSNRKVFGYYKIGFLSGIVSSVMDRTVLILIMMVFGSSLQLGILSTVFAVFTIITTWLMNRFYKKGKAKPVIVISATMPLLAVMILFANTNVATVIFYRIVNSVFICILSLMSNIERYDCLEEKFALEYQTEHQAMSELALAAGRILGLSILLIVNSLIGGLYAILIMLIFISFSIIAYAYFISKQ